jgi:hypothetical protein
MNTTEKLSNPVDSFDWISASKGDFQKLIADYRMYLQQQEAPSMPSDLKEGWNDYTREHCEYFLYKTVFDTANRAPDWATVVYYAWQMVEHDWKKTGQAIIFDTDGRPWDGQHRVWAGLLTGVTFPTYVVLSTPPEEALFAYIDNMRVRRGKEALEAAGLNGNSTLINSVVQIARHYDAGVMTPTKKGRVRRASPLEVLKYAQAHSEIRQAILTMNEKYEAAIPLFLKKDTAAFIVWKVLELYGEDALDEFITGLVKADFEGKNSGGDALIALRKKLEEYVENNTYAGTLIGGKKQQKISQCLVLAHTIKAFNAWHSHTFMKSVSVPSDAAMPTFDGIDTDQEAA